MRSRVPGFVAVLFVGAAATLAVIAGASAILPRNEGEWVNPGSPLSPSDYVGQDWDRRGDATTDESLAIRDVRRRAGLRLLLRRDAEAGLMAAERIVVQPGQLQSAGTAYDGYTIKYGDRVHLVVNPSDVPLDVDERVASEVMKTTLGETRLWSRVSVRGNAGAFRKQAVQKWESGEVNKMPAVLEWSEPCSEGPEYIHYALLGELSLSELKALAQSLTRE